MIKIELFKDFWAVARTSTFYWSSLSKMLLFCLSYGFMLFQFLFMQAVKSWKHWRYTTLLACSFIFIILQILLQLLYSWEHFLIILECHSLRYQSLEHQIIVIFTLNGNYIISIGALRSTCHSLFFLSNNCISRKRLFKYALVLLLNQKVCLPFSSLTLVKLLQMHLLL